MWKYVATTGVLDILLMDHLCAVYLRFTSANPGALFDPVEFITTPSDQDAATKDGPRLTLREIIVLVCCRALKAKGIKFRNMADCPTPITGEYRHVLNHRPPSKKGPNTDNVDRRVQPKRGGAVNKSQADPTDTDTTPDFRHWELDSVVTLQIPDTRKTPALTVSRVRAISTDSGSTTQPRYRVAHPPLTPETPKMTFHVAHCLTPTVAVLSPCFPSALGHSVIGKIPRSEKHLTVELATYATLANLQGSEIPHCYGAYQLATAPCSTVLLIELISPLRNVQALRDEGDWETLHALRTRRGRLSVQFMTLALCIRTRTLEIS